MTHAEEIAKQFDDDGQCWRDGDGQHISDVCEDGALTSSVCGVGVIRYVFEDESAIVTAEGGWDVEGDAPFSWEGGGR